MATKSAITPKKPDADQAKADAFLAGRKGDAKAVRMKGTKSIVTISLAPTVLEQLDAWADAQGISRSAALSVAIRNIVS